MTDNFSTKTQLFFSILALSIVIPIAYANTLFSPFNFDDQALLHHVILNDPDGYSQVWPIRYRHFLYFSFSFNHSISGLNSYSYHLTNLFFHFLTSVAILLIAFKTLTNNTSWGAKSALGLSTTAALLFALNPLHAETVTYVSGRATGIGAFFYLLALLFFVLGSETRSTSKKSLPIYYALTLFAFGLALLSKETTLTLPLAIVLYDLCFMRNANWHPFRTRLYIIYLPLSVLVGAFLFLSPVINNLMMDWLGKINPDYALTQSRILAYALKLCFFPINLTFDYDFPSNWGQHGFSLFALVGLWLVLIFLLLKNFRRISPLVTFSILWFLITLSPTNSFLPRADLLSERNLYLPSIGFTFLIAALLFRLFFMNSQVFLPKLGVALLATLILAQSSLLIIRNSDYRSNIHLWEDTYRKSPADLKVLHNLSHFYLEDKRYQQALVPLLKLSRSDAGDFYRAFAHSNLGSIYTQSGNFDRAKREFNKAIDLEPTLPLGYLNLGTYYATRGRFQDARTEFLRAQERYIKYRWGYPMPLELDLNLARVNLELKKFSEAEKHIHQYLSGAPDSSDGLLLLGKIYQTEGKFEKAEKAYQKNNSGGLASAKAYNNLGILYIKKESYEKARDAFISSINFYPQIPDAHYNLGKLIIDLKGDPAMAKNHLKIALSLNQSPALRKEIDRLLKSQ